MIVETDEDAYRELARLMKNSIPRFFVSRSYATVVAVSGNTCSIRYDGETQSDSPHAGTMMTTACAGIKAGDRVLVDTVDHLSTITGIIAR